MQIKGIILRSVPCKEKDAVITVITKDAVLSFYAKGIASLKSKNAAALNLYSYSLLELNEGPQGGLSLKEAIIIDSFANCFSSLESLATLSCFSELILKDIESSDAKYIFPYLVKAEELINNGFDPLTILNIFFAHTLNVEGIGLDVKECVICHKRSDIVAISFKDGGFICRDCFEASTAHSCLPRILNIYRYIFMVDVNSMDKATFSRKENLEIFNKLCKHRNDLTGLILKSQELINC